ncbi:aldo/keto reductase [Humisphaera borealis]|uniref:Aldo/keto reductase n=1 Tax=Humisphaera borealis TaxID=2807512 RepID=A0A7M2X1H8_9BACT|nr:aldo/keto reductase [Humisphaera borealis]
MQFRPLGSSGIQVSCVGFGTAQLRRVPRTQAIDTLLAGFDRGVSIVHTAPDYEGADRLVAEAVLRSGRKIIVASNGYDTSGNATGKVRHFERLFESTCRMLKTDRLELFGIASVEDREAGQENIWGKDGMVEFLQKMKATGRLGAIFCTTHGKPEFARRLIESGAFDAIMLSYNVLGFHSLTLNPPASWHFEDIRRTREELFPLCKAKGMGLMIMLPLAAGMLTPSKAFPPPDGSAAVPPGVAAGEALRAILENPEVSCVLPGTASVEEAIENASAGVAERIATRPEAGPHALRIAEMTTSLCSRCGECEPTCSQGLPVAWLFRAAYMGGVYRTSPYETWEDVEYFRLQPQGPSTCSGCVQQTCRCPARIDIPITLDRLHQTMLRRVSEGRVQPPPELRLPPRGDRWCSARLVTRELPLARSLKQVWRAGREHRPPTVDQVWYRDRRAPSIPTRKPCRNRRRAAVRRDAGGSGAISCWNGRHRRLPAPRHLLRSNCSIRSARSHCGDRSNCFGGTSPTGRCLLEPVRTSSLRRRMGRAQCAIALASIFGTSGLCSCPQRRHAHLARGRAKGAICGPGHASGRGNSPHGACATRHPSG